jgi:hypothetical protein
VKKAISTAAVASVVCVGTLLIAHGAPASAQSFDGRWESVYDCDRNTRKPHLGPFTWKIAFDVKNNIISGEYNYHTWEGYPVTARFTGRFDRMDKLKINVAARFEKGGYDFYQTLTGEAISDRSIELAGSMLVQNGIKVRNCQLKLNLIAPALPSEAKTKKPIHDAGDVLPVDVPEFG